MNACSSEQTPIVSQPLHKSLFCLVVGSCWIRLSCRSNAVAIEKTSACLVRRGSGLGFFSVRLCWSHLPFNKGAPSSPEFETGCSFASKDDTWIKTNRSRSARRRGAAGGGGGGGSRGRGRPRRSRSRGGGLGGREEGERTELCGRQKGGEEEEEEQEQEALAIMGRKVARLWDLQIKAADSLTMSIPGSKEREQKQKTTQEGRRAHRTRSTPAVAWHSRPRPVGAPTTRRELI